MKRTLLVAALTLAPPISAASQILLPDGPACASCSIVFEPLATLGAADGPGALSNVIRVVLDQNGRYWVFSEGEMPKLFAQNGTYLQTLGRKGKGPGEFEWPYDLWQLTRDSLAIVDAAVRIHVFSSNLQYARTLQTPVFDPGAALVLSWPTAVLINAHDATPARLGLPFHLVDFSSPPRVQRSFGATNESVTANTARAIVKQAMTKSRNGGYWAARANRYLIARMSDKHESEFTLERRPAWFSDASTMMEGGPEHPPNPRCLGVIEDERGLLWSFCLKPAANWKKAYERLKTRIPQRGIAELPGDLIDRQFLYVTHVEVIDPVAKQVVAVGSLNREVISLLADRRVAVLTESEDGVPVLRILRTNLTGYRR